MIFARVLLLLIALRLSLHRGCSAKTQTWTPQAVSEACYKLINNSMQMEHICHSKLTPRTSVLTRSPLFKAKHVVSIFLSKDRTVNLITINKSPLHVCKRLVVLDTYMFSCIRKGVASTVIIKESKLYCFPHHLYISDLVAESCNHPHIGFVGKTKYDIIQLTAVDSGSTSHLPWRTLVSLGLMAVLMQFLITR